MNHTFHPIFTCPACKQRIKLDDEGKILGHETSFCTGRAIEWEGCSVDVNKPHPDFFLVRDVASMIDFVVGVIEMARTIKGKK